MVDIATQESRVGHHYELAATHLESGADREAIAEFRTALHEADRLYAMVSRELGALLQSQGSHEKALEAFEHGLSRAPSDASCLFQAGVTLNRLGRFEEALDRLEQALDHEASRAEIYQEIARAYRKRGWYSEALHALEQGLELDGERPSLRRDTAAVLSKLGRQEQAIACLEKALTLLPGETTGTAHGGRPGNGIVPTEAARRQELGSM